MTAEPSPAHVAAVRGREQRRAADEAASRRAQEAAVTVEPARPVPAPTLDRQGDAESRAVEAAADELCAGHGDLANVAKRAHRHVLVAIVRRVLAAAVPHLERRIRESIAEEIEARRDDPCPRPVNGKASREAQSIWFYALESATRIARGSSS